METTIHQRHVSYGFGYIIFNLGGLRFSDSLQFINASLERLVENLTNDEFKFLHKFVDGPKQQELLLGKDVYPYDYVDRPAKLEKTQLPPKQEFHSKLYEEGISDQDFQHAKNVWRTFNC